MPGRLPFAALLAALALAGTPSSFLHTASAAASDSLAWSPPSEFTGDFGSFRPVLRFDDGRPVTTRAQWAERRQEILRTWHDDSLLGTSRRVAMTVRPGHAPTEASNAQIYDFFKKILGTK